VVSAPVVHIGPQSAEQVGYDLVWEARLGRADDWRRDAVRTAYLVEALAAEAVAGGWVGQDGEGVARW